MFLVQGLVFANCRIVSGGRSHLLGSLFGFGCDYNLLTWGRKSVAQLVAEREALGIRVTKLEQKVSDKEEVRATGLEQEGLEQEGMEPEELELEGSGQEELTDSD